MVRYCFRIIRRDGEVVSEAYLSATDLGEAVAYGLKFASGVKSNYPPGTGCDTWFLDVIDGSGQVALSLPLAMVSRRGVAA